MTHQDLIKKHNLVEGEPIEKPISREPNNYFTYLDGDYEHPVYIFFGPVK